MLLDGVTDVRNLSAIALSAEVYGAHGIIISQKNSAGFTPDAIKSSAGALLRISVCREKSPVNTMETLQMSGAKVIASDLKADKMLYKLELTEPVYIVMGAEGGELSPRA